VQWPRTVSIIKIWISCFQSLALIIVWIQINISHAVFNTWSSHGGLLGKAEGKTHVIYHFLYHLYIVNSTDNQKGMCNLSRKALALTSPHTELTKKALSYFNVNLYKISFRRHQFQFILVPNKRKLLSLGQYHQAFIIKYYIYTNTCYITSALDIWLLNNSSVNHIPFISNSMILVTPDCHLKISLQALLEAKRGSFPGAKVWSYTSTPSYVFMMQYLMTHRG
jgi:hypothetical protein